MTIRCMICLTCVFYVRYDIYVYTGLAKSMVAVKCYSLSVDCNHTFGSVYIYMFVGCVVLVINKSTMKKNNTRHST